MFLIHNKKHKHKPNTYEVATIQNTWNNAILSDNINILVKALKQGQTIKFNYDKLEFLIIDADKPSYPLEYYLNTLKANDLSPLIAYKSFSANNINKHNFRLIYRFEYLTKNTYINFTLKLQNLLNISLDFAFANNHKQICYGTNKEVLLLNQSPNIQLDNTPINNQNNTLKETFTNQKANDIIYLNSLPYKQFINELKDTLKTKKHISYDLALRWTFANFNNPKLINEILELVSLENQQKITKLLNQKDNNYLLRLVPKYSNFYKIYLSNKKRLKKQ